MSSSARRWLLTLALAWGAGCGGDDVVGIDAAAALDAAPDAADGTAGADAASADAGPFTCGASVCDPAGQYCYEVQAGAGGAAVAAAAGTGCRSLPAQCDAPATCECVLAHSHDGCPLEPTCEADGDRVTVLCGLP